MAESRILYAEDDALTRLFVSKIIDRVGVVAGAGNGAEAFDMFQQDSFDLLVTDLSMPIMDGFQLIQQIRNINPNFPIVVTTAYRDEYLDIRNLENLTIVDKPINAKVLTSTIESFLK